MPVADNPALSESTREDLTSLSCQATENHLMVKPAIGQLWMFDVLNA
jgi:hypothetical protein